MEQQYAAITQHTLSLFPYGPAGPGRKRISPNMVTMASFFKSVNRQMMVLPNFEIKPFNRSFWYSYPNINWPIAQKAFAVLHSGTRLFYRYVLLFIRYNIQHPCLYLAAEEPSFRPSACLCHSSGENGHQGHQACGSKWQGLPAFSSWMESCKYKKTCITYVGHNAKIYSVMTRKYFVFYKLCARCRTAFPQHL